MASNRAKGIAESAGLYHVYIGNILRPDGETTWCPSCKTKLIERRRYTILRNRLKDGTCPACGTEVMGIWK